jgi:hypothetical protein
MLAIISIAILVLVEPVRAQSTVTNGLQKCGDAMFRVDVDNGGNVNRAEYINMLMEISPYKTYAEFGVIASDSCPTLEALRIFSEMHPCPLF